MSKAEVITQGQRQLTATWTGWNVLLESVLLAKEGTYNDSEHIRRNRLSWIGTEYPCGSHALL